MDNINLDKVIETYNKLLHWPEKETGTSFFYKCPYHKEKTSSFAVKKENWIFKCFWCWKSWNIITLIKDHFSWQQDELFEILWLWYNKGKRKRAYNIKDYIKKEIIKNLPWKIEQRLNDNDLKYLYERWFSRDFIRKYNFFNLNNNVSSNVLTNMIKEIEEKNKKEDNEENKKYNKATLNKYRTFLETQAKYYNWYLIIPTIYQNNFTNNYMFIWRNTSAWNWPRYKNEKMNKDWKTFYVWKNNDSIITIMEWTIDWMVYNNFTNKTVNLLLWANKISYENKSVTFLTDNDQAWFEFLWNLYDFDSMLNNNNVTYIFWSISYKEVFKNFFLKYLSDKYKYDIDSDVFNNLIEQYWKILMEIKDINEVYKFLLKLLYITEQTLWKNKEKEFVQQIEIDNVLTFSFTNINYEYIERKDVQNSISELINVFDKANIEQNTFLIFFLYYNILKNKIEVMNNVDIQFFIDKLKELEQVNDLIVENIKKVISSKNPYFIMSILLYYFWIENFVKLSNLFLFKSNNIDNIETNIIKGFDKFVKQYKITLLQPELLYLLNKLSIIQEQTYRDLVIKIEKNINNKSNTENVDYETLLKSKMYYWRLFIIPLLISLFKTDKTHNFLLNLVWKNNKDVLNIVNLLLNNNSNLSSFTDIRKINELQNIFKKYVEMIGWTDIDNDNVWSKFLNLFWLNEIENLSEINYIVEEINKNDIDKNIELIWLESLLKIRTEKDILNYIDRHSLDKEEVKENIANTLNELNEWDQKWKQLTNKTDSGILLNMIQNNKEKIDLTIKKIEKENKLNKIILNILQSFILYV